MKRFVALALIAGAFAAPAHAGGTLYKSVDANGTILFSDTRPTGDVTVVEERSLPSPSTSGRIARNAAQPVQTVEGDEVLARANVQVDLAEHALALARRNLWSAGDVLKLQQPRTTQADTQRVEFYKKNLRSARVYLAELVRERQMQEIQLAANSAENTGLRASAPMLVATNYNPR
ncbi:MAG: DUF4124 domain-containing protein [Usitatibacter sp.]